MSPGALNRLSIPALLLIAAAVFRRDLAGLGAAYLRLLDGAPYLFLGLALLLSYYFNRARLFTLTLAWLAGYGVIRSFLQGSLLDPSAVLVYSLLGIGLPLSALYLLLAPEHGLRNRHGFSMAAGLALLWLAGAWMVESIPAAASAFVQSHLPIKHASGYYLSLYSTGLFLAATVAGIWLLARHGREDEAALVSATAFAWVTLGFLDEPKISAVMFSAAGVALTFSLIRSSHEMVYRDELTGIPGRRAFNDALKGLGGQYVIAMLDVDYFKRFNDTWGHDVGDDVLKMVARRIAEVRGGGSAFRYGGEEFAIVFPGREIAECRPYFEEVRKSVERYQLTVRDSDQRPPSGSRGSPRRGRRRQPRGETVVSVTISIGVAQSSDPHDAPDDVVKAADAALYRAKEKGRNCISR